MTFDLRTHVRDPKSGRVVKKQAYQLRVTPHGQFFVRDGVRYHVDGTPLDQPAPEPVFGKEPTVAGPKSPSKPDFTAPSEPEVVPPQKPEEQPDIKYMDPERNVIEPEPKPEPEVHVPDDEKKPTVVETEKNEKGEKEKAGKDAGKNPLHEGKKGKH